MLIRYCLGLALIETACALAAWGAWSNHALGRGWATSLAFATPTLGSALAGALCLGIAIREDVAGEGRHSPSDAADARS